MRNRPWPLVLLALIQILTPFFTILFNAWMLQVTPFQVLGWVIHREPLEIFETLILMPLGGAAIFMMKRWSYPVFLSAMGWSIFRNIRDMQYATGALSTWAIVSIYVFDIVLVGYFLLPEVRATYFDPNVRWWETKPRYVLKMAAMLRVAETSHPGTILNLSEGGAFVSAPEPYAMGALLELRFEVCSRPFSVLGKVVHVRKISDGETCYGIQFAHTDETQEQMVSLTRALRELGFQDRVEKKSVLVSVFEGILQFFKTGKGWKPQVVYRKKD